MKLYTERDIDRIARNASFGAGTITDTTANDASTTEHTHEVDFTNLTINDTLDVVYIHNVEGILGDFSDAFNHSASIETYPITFGPGVGRVVIGGMSSPNPILELANSDTSITGSATIAGISATTCDSNITAGYAVAAIEFLSASAYTTDACPGIIVFSTTASGSNLTAERLRIDEAGAVIVKSTGNLITPIIYGSADANGDITIEGTSSATRTTSVVYLQPNGGGVLIGDSTVGQFNVSGSTGNASLLTPDGAILSVGSTDTSIAAAGELFGEIDFYVSDTQITTSNVAAKITVQSSAGIADDSLRGDMIFSVGGTNTPAAVIEHMRFTPTTVAKIGFFGATPVVKPAALTTALTTITAPAYTPDTAIQAVTINTPYGFVNANEGNTVINSVRNLMVRVAELESKLQALGLLA